MALNPKDEERLEDGARRARVEFEAHWKEWGVRDVARWWNKWCRYEGTNHDRLGRILIEVTGVKPLTGVPVSPEELKELGLE